MPFVPEEWINPRTGEVADPFYVIRGSKYPRGTEFVTMFQNGFDYLSGLRLTPTQTAVLFKLLSKLDYENWITLSQLTIGQDLKLNQGDVSKAMSALVKHKIIEVTRDPQDRRRLSYRLSELIGWRGRAAEWVKARHHRTIDNVIPMPGIRPPRQRLKPDILFDPPEPDSDKL